jgi:hypothetical protein
MRFRLSRTLGATVLAATLTATALAVATPTTRANGGLSPDKLGMYVGYNRGDRFADMERQLQQPIKWVVTMADKRSPTAMSSSAWGQLTSADAYLPKVADRVNLVMSVPVGFGEGGLYRKTGGRELVRQNLLDVAAGKHDDSYRRVARHLIGAGYGDAVLRLGHEFDGTYEPYSARENNDAYIAAYRHVHDLFERESASFRFEWTSMRSEFRQHGPPAYPGDRYVDIVGLDIYYREPGVISDQVWKDQYQAVLIAHRDFAVSRGKPVAYSEWGRAKADESRFIGLMHGWFSSLPDRGPGGLVYQSYFNEAWADYDLARLPTVRASYLGLFGRNGAPAPATPTTQPATTQPATTQPATTQPATTQPATTQPATSAPLTTLAPAQRLTFSSASVTGAGTLTAPTSDGNPARIALTPRPAALELAWFHPGDGARNVRHRIVGSTQWTWVSNGSWNQVISGLRTSTPYEVQVRAKADGVWQSWMKAMATTN